RQHFGQHFGRRALRAALELDARNQDAALARRDFERAVVGGNDRSRLTTPSALARDTAFPDEKLPLIERTERPRIWMGHGANQVEYAPRGPAPVDAPVFRAPPAEIAAAREILRP